MESRLPFVQISFIPIEKRLRRRETGVKDGFEEWNTNFRLEHSVGKNRTTLSDVPLSPDIFRGKDAKSPVPWILVNLRLNNRTAGRKGRQIACAWRTWKGYNLRVLSWSSLTQTFSGLLQKDLFKEKLSLGKSCFKQNYCHAFHTRFAFFSCCV